MVRPKSILKSPKSKKTAPKKVKFEDLEEEVEVVDEVEILEEEDAEIEEEVVAEKRPRKKPTIDDHLQHYTNLFEILNAEIDRKSRMKEKGVRSFRTARNLLLQMRKELSYMVRSKEARKKCSTRKPNTGGLEQQYYVSPELAAFLQISTDEPVKRLDVTRAICVYIGFDPNDTREEVLVWAHLNPGGKRKLQNPEYRIQILPDAALSRLLKYPQYKKNVAAGKIKQKHRDAETGEMEQIVLDDDSCYYSTIQRLLTPHFVEKVLKPEIVEDEETVDIEDDEEEEMEDDEEEEMEDE